MDMDGSALLHAHSGFEVAFLVNIGIVLIGVTNVVTSVSVEAAIRSAQYYCDLTAQDKQLERKSRSATYKKCPNIWTWMVQARSTWTR